jgi:hypothetical protein
MTKAPEQTHQTMSQNTQRLMDPIISNIGVLTSPPNDSFEVITPG